LPQVLIDKAQVNLLLDRLDAACTEVEHDSRATPRHPLRGQAICVQLAAPPAVKPFLVRLRNLSEGGIAFLTGSMLVPGCRIRLTLPSEAGSRTERLAIVRRIREVEPKVFEAGADFLD